MTRDIQHHMNKVTNLTKQVRAIIPYFEDKFWQYFCLKVSGKIMTEKKQLIEFCKKYPVPVTRELEHQILMEPQKVLTKSLVRALIKGKYIVEKVYK